MGKNHAALVERYRPLMEAGVSARDLYAQARAEGCKVFEAMGAVLNLFGISMKEAEQIKQQVDGFGPGMPRMETEEQLCAILKQEVTIQPFLRHETLRQCSS